MKQKLHFFVFSRFLSSFSTGKIIYGLEDINLPKKMKKMSFSKVVLRGEMKRNPAFGGATKLIFVR